MFVFACNGRVLSKQQHTCDQIRLNMKSLFSQRERNFFADKKMLVRDKLNNMMVTLTTMYYG